MTPAQIEPPTQPSTPGLWWDAFHAAGERRGGGGAWHDVFAVSDGCVVVSIGAVSGGGVDVAAVVSAVRAAFGPGDEPAGPKALLLAADAAFRRAAAEATSATALIGIVDSTEGSFTYVSAGHPPPFIRFHDGTVSALPTEGHPVGRAEHEYPPAQVAVDLGGAAVVVLYAGALATAVADGADGPARLAYVLADERLAHVGNPAAWIARRILGTGSLDDTALIALSFPQRRPPPDALGLPAGERPRWSVSWSFDSTGAASAGARRAFLACLASKQTGGAAIDAAAAELIFGELLGNVVRHAPGPVEITLDWTAELPVLHVLDNGPGFRSRRKRERLPVDELSESGRGLFIVNACAQAFSVRNRTGRGTHARATLPRA